MIDSPTVTIVADTAPRTVDRRYMTLDDIEASTPLGRRVHKLEGLAFSGSQQAVYYRGARDQRISHDQRADLHIAAIASEVQRVLSRGGLSLEIATSMHLILGDCGGYFEADRREDAAAVNGDRRVEAMHASLKRIGAWCESLATAIRERVRGGSGR